MASDLRLRALRAPAAALASAALLLTGGGCGQGPAAPVQAAAPRDLMAEAVEAMARRDYATAASALRRVIERSPDHFEAHYRLGVSASHLDLADEATREFEWVVAHGGANSPEVRLARDWLAARRRPAPDETLPPPTSTPDPTRATLSGRVVWEDNGIQQPRPWVRLFLQGVKGTPVEDEFFRVQTDQNGAYEITGIPPGEYRLTDRGSGTTTWRLKVTLKPGQNVVLDLSPANSVRVRDDFPDPAGS
ncbi:MAG TPA: carboxypeptidase regulatory-like domain-containing protein [Candidatus Binatia bacterium]|nr:carboxypeptidase regulatory-like domain-containing protein [Candidatus Binatia bacterium]